MVVEDEVLTASKIEMQIDLLGHELFAQVDNSDDAIAELQKAQPDLILMDVNIEGDYDGIELADLIHQQWDIPIIFITSLQDDRTFKRIVRTNPVGYIVKPFAEAQLKHSIDLVLKQLHQKTEALEVEEPAENSSDKKGEYLFIKKRNQLEKIKIADIFYLEADGRYCQIYTLNKKFLIRMPLKDVFEKVQSTHFIQTHRSYIVNINKIKTVNLEESVIVLENRQVPLSRREKDLVLAKLDWI